MFLLPAGPEASGILFLCFGYQHQGTNFQTTYKFLGTWSIKTRFQDIPMHESVCVCDCKCNPRCFLI